MLFGGTGCLGKLCNEEEKAFDIFCRRLQAVSLQNRRRIMGGGGRKEETVRRFRIRDQEERLQERKREGLGGGEV